MVWVMFMCVPVKCCYLQTRPAVFRIVDQCYACATGQWCKMKFIIGFSDGFSSASVLCWLNAVKPPLSVESAD